MSYRNVLFIGGPKHGCLVPVTYPHPPHWHIAHPVGLLGLPDPAENVCDYATAVYRHADYRYSAFFTPTSVYVALDWTDEQATAYMESLPRA